MGMPAPLPSAGSVLPEDCRYGTYEVRIYRNAREEFRQTRRGFRFFYDRYY